MFDRERTESQDIEFDFFDESPTAEATPRGDGLRRRRKLPPRPPAPPGGPQLYRLGVLIAGAIVLAVILILVVNSCRGNQRQAEYEGYVDDVGAVASESAALGRTLNERLTTPGIRLEDLRSDVEGLQQQQEQILRAAQGLQPPGPLVEQQESLVEAMQFRVNGLGGLAAALGEVAQATDADEAGALLAVQTRRLTASDIVYADAFQAATQAVLREQDVGDVAVPDSVFLLNPELASAAAWKPVVQRLTQGPQGGGGLHGNGIEAVRVMPGGQALSPSEDNTVQASDQLAFQVRILNSGDNQEVQVPVTLIIQQDPVIRKRQVIDQINPQETKTLTFRDLGNVSFTRVILRVTVEPVAGEENTANNTVQYPVIFTLQ